MKHKGTVCLQTQRLILRRFREEDAPVMFRNWASDPRVTKFLTWPTHSGADASLNFIRFLMSGYAKEDSYEWGIELKQTGEVIGSIGAVELNEVTESVTIGYCIGYDWWGKGIMAEALRRVIAFFFEEVGAACVNAEHDCRNPNSGKVMRKAGMKREGIRRREKTNNQGVCDCVWYSLLREEYELYRDHPDAIWREMYAAAKERLNPRILSPFVEAGGVAAAVQSASGNIYTGVCIDTAASLGMCAERNAIANMLTHGETGIQRVIAVGRQGNVIPPCAVCREYMMQLGPDSGDIEIMLDLEKGEAVPLRDLVPHWWGTERFFNGFGNMDH